MFAQLALDRCSEQRHDVAWLDAALSRADARFVVLRADGKTLVDADEQALLLLDRARCDVLTDTHAATLLGCDEAQAPYFALLADAQAAQGIPGSKFIDLRRAAQCLPTFESGLFAYARGLTHWQLRTRWCGACGTSVLLEWAGHRARCPNPACALEHYPRTDPAIIVIVTWRDACLLGRQPGWAPGHWSTLAGFVEPGETLEDAVRREVFEESGVRVVDCDYHSSQPWPFPASLMLGFTARADDPAIACGAELCEARWFEVDAFVDGLANGEIKMPRPLSVSYRLIEHWLRQASGLELSKLPARGTWP